MVNSYGSFGKYVTTPPILNIFPNFEKCHLGVSIGNVLAKFGVPGASWDLGTHVPLLSLYRPHPL